MRSDKFPSSLPVTGERVLLDPRTRPHLESFNPRSPSPGSVSTELFETLVNLQVSILAPRHRGACLVQSADATTLLACFNPRSPSPGSVSRRVFRTDARRTVSILAPRHRGACPVSL